MIDFSKIKYFDEPEFRDPHVPESGRLIARETILCLMGLREETGWAIIPHAVVGGCVDVAGSWGHSLKSYHRKDCGACAVDWHFDTDANPREQAAYVLRSGFTGIGFYYDWKWNGGRLSIGFHGDNRPKHKTALWRRVSGSYTYLLQ